MLPCCGHEGSGPQAWTLQCPQILCVPRHFCPAPPPSSRTPSSAACVAHPETSSQRCRPAAFRTSRRHRAHPSPARRGVGTSSRRAATIGSPPPARVWTTRRRASIPLTWACRTGSPPRRRPKATRRPLTLRTPRSPIRTTSRASALGTDAMGKPSEHVSSTVFVEGGLVASPGNMVHPRDPAAGPCPRRCCQNGRRARGPPGARRLAHEVGPVAGRPDFVGGRRRGPPWRPGPAYWETLGVQLLDRMPARGSPGSGSGPKPDRSEVCFELGIGWDLGESWCHGSALDIQNRLTRKRQRFSFWEWHPDGAHLRDPRREIWADTRGAYSGRTLRARASFPSTHYACTRTRGGGALLRLLASSSPVWCIIGPERGLRNSFVTASRVVFGHVHRWSVSVLERRARKLWKQVDIFQENGLCSEAWGGADASSGERETDNFEISGFGYITGIPERKAKH